GGGAQNGRRPAAPPRHPAPASPASPPLASWRHCRTGPEPSGQDPPPISRQCHPVGAETDHEATRTNRRPVRPAASLTNDATSPTRRSDGTCTIWYMIVDSSVEIDAPATTVWDIFADVERWPEWTASVERIVALDGPGIEVGKRFEIKQPQLPKLVWEVTEVQPGRSWSWHQRRPGATTI